MRGGEPVLVAAASISVEVLPLAGSRARLRVHSTFDRAINLCLESPAPRTNAVRSLPLGMVTVARVEVGNLPNGILIPPGPAPLPGLARAGQPVWLAGGRLRLEGGEIDLRGARPWDGSLDALRSPGWDAGWWDRWLVAWRLLRDGVSGGAARDSSPLFGASAGRVGRLVSALGRRDLGGALAAAEGLVGLGPGLTPSGDDLLVGLLIGMQCRPPGAGGRGFVAAWGAGLLAVADGTTDVSRVYLAWAARGRATQRLRDVAEAIVRPRAGDELARAVDAALNVGATSGADGLLGLLLGLRTWMDESEGNHADAAQGVIQPVSRLGDADAAIEHAGIAQGGEAGLRRDGHAGQRGPVARRRDRG